MWTIKGGEKKLKTLIKGETRLLGGKTPLYVWTLAYLRACEFLRDKGSMYTLGKAKSLILWRYGRSVQDEWSVSTVRLTADGVVWVDQTLSA